MRQRAIDLAREIKALEGIEGVSQLAGERQAEAAKLQEQARGRATALQFHFLGIIFQCWKALTNLNSGRCNQIINYLYY
ncbi:MAG: hypothetical protein WA137_00085 [Methanothrix sp.]